MRELGEQLFVHPRRVTEPHNVTCTRELHQVLVPCIVFGKQKKMERRVLDPFDRYSISPPTDSNIDFRPDDWLYPGLLSFFVEINCTEKVAVICDSECGQAPFLGFCDDARSWLGRYQ